MNTVATCNNNKDSAFARFPQRQKHVENTFEDFLQFPDVVGKANPCVTGFPPFAARQIHASPASRHLRQGKSMRHWLPAICGKANPCVVGGKKTCINNKKK